MFKKIRRRYYKSPILYDLMLGIVIGTIFFILSSLELNLLRSKHEIVESIAGILINSCLPLIGFLLTMLTIVLSIKTLVEGKTEKSKGIEIFFDNDHHYGTLVSTIFGAVWEQFYCLIGLVIVESIKVDVIFPVYSSLILSFGVILLFSILRILYLLHLMLKSLTSTA